MAGSADLVHGAVATLGKVAEMVGIVLAMGECADVMRQKDVDPVEAEPLQIILEGAHDAVIAIVIDDMKRQRIDHSEIGRVVHRPGFQKPADLVGQDVVGVAQKVAHDTFGPAEAVPWRGIEIADSGILRRLD